MELHKIKNNSYEEDVITNKELYRKYNKLHCIELFNNDVIRWYSGETNHNVANYVKIIKQDENFLLSFNTQPYIVGYDTDTHHFNSITIRFRNSGRRYEPFNTLFMKIYNSLQSFDDEKDYGHQMCFEEYLYERERKLVK